MAVRFIENPERDLGWAELLDRHPRASVFHSPEWLSALRQTYGYEPLAVTTSSSSTLANGMVFCRVKGWGAPRLVSLPFSDHADPLVNSADELSEMLTCVAAEARMRGWGAIEVRPRATDDDVASALKGAGLEPGDAYYTHRVDLRPAAQDIFRRMHPSNTQRAIRRAEREGLSYARGRSDDLLESFYQLLRMTRRRHGLPPQPLAWFRNLVMCLGDSLTIHVASKDGRPVASLVTSSFKNTIVYKYGASDAAHHSLGGMPFLFWRVIQEATRAGAIELDLGRSDVDQPGLVAFKEHLGGTRSTLTYYRYPHARPRVARNSWMTRTARGVFAHLPNSALDLAGRVLYRRLG